MARFLTLFVRACAVAYMGLGVWAAAQYNDWTIVITGAVAVVGALVILAGCVGFEHHYSRRTNAVRTQSDTEAHAE